MVEAPEGFCGFVGCWRPARPLPLGGLLGQETSLVEIGWRLAWPAWGRGFAVRGARLALATPSPLRLSEVVAYTAAVNAPSLRVMERLGMSEVGGFDHPGLPEGHELRPHGLSADGGGISRWWRGGRRRLRVSSLEPSSDGWFSASREKTVRDPPGCTIGEPGRHAMSSEAVETPGRTNPGPVRRRIEILVPDVRTPAFRRERSGRRKPSLRAPGRRTTRISSYDLNRLGTLTGSATTRGEIWTVSGG